MSSIHSSAWPVVTFNPGTETPCLSPALHQRLHDVSRQIGLSARAENVGELLVNLRGRRRAEDNDVGNLLKLDAVGR